MNDETRIVIENNTKQSIPILGIITILLVCARIFGFIDLAWVWVFAPLWVPPVVILGVVILGLAFMIIFGAVGVLIIWLGEIIGSIGRKIRGKKKIKKD